MRILVDINVLLDVILEREPCSADATRLLAAIERGRPRAYVAGHTLTTIHYIVARVAGARRATSAIIDVLRLAEVVPVERVDFEQAIALGLHDFEDAVQAACAIKVGADAIATRNAKDFGELPIPCLTPALLLARLATG